MVIPQLSPSIIMFKQLTFCSAEINIFIKPGPSILVFLIFLSFKLAAIISANSCRFFLEVFLLASDNNLLQSRLEIFSTNLEFTCSDDFFIKYYIIFISNLNYNFLTVDLSLLISFFASSHVCAVSSINFNLFTLINKNRHLYFYMPDESFAGFKVFETVSPFRPGSVSETVLVTNVGSSTFKTSPSQKRILHSSSPSNQSLIFFDLICCYFNLFVSIFVHEYIVLSFYIQKLKISFNYVCALYRFS